MLPIPEPPLRRVSQRDNKGVPPMRYGLKVEVANVQEPNGWDEMLQLPQQEQQKWLAAADQEIASLKQKDVWELTTLPAGRRAITAKWVFKAKLDAHGQVDVYKARLVARGFTQRYGSDYEETFAPVVKHETVRVLLAVAAIKGLHVRHLDVKSAYLNGELKEELYLEQPQGYVIAGQEGKVLRLKKSLYGLKQSAHAWNKTATETLARMGFKRGEADHCLFTRIEKSGSRTYVLLYVDDLLVVGADEDVTARVGRQLDKFFETKNLGDVSNYLGVQVEREEDGSFLIHQKTKIAIMLGEHGLVEPRPVDTPMETGFLSSTQDSPRMPNNTRYRQAIGSLLHIATVSRPDVAAAVGILCRRVQEPTESDWKAVKRVMRFLATTVDKKLRLSSDGEVELEGFADADWGGCHIDRKSTSGYVFRVGQSVVAWASRKQCGVSASSTESEYVSAAMASKELLWLRQLVKDLGFQSNGPTVINEDNQGCIRLIESDRLTARTKHIDISYHLVRDLCERDIVAMKYCPSSDMIADILTKPLPKAGFTELSKKLGLR